MLLWEIACAPDAGFSVAGDVTPDGNDLVYESFIFAYSRKRILVKIRTLAENRNTPGGGQKLIELGTSAPHQCQARGLTLQYICAAVHR